MKVRSARRAWPGKAQRAGLPQQAVVDLLLKVVFLGAAVCNRRTAFDPRLGPVRQLKTAAPWAWDQRSAPTEISGTELRFRRGNEWVLSVINDARPALIGTAGTVPLDQISSVVGILVGLATLVYLVVRIRKEVK